MCKGCEVRGSLVPPGGTRRLLVAGAGGVGREGPAGRAGPACRASRVPGRALAQPSIQNLSLVGVDWDRQGWGAGRAVAPSGGERPDRQIWAGQQGGPDCPALVPMGRFLGHLGSLSREVNLDYERSMNKMNFDRVVSSQPHTFSYVTLPQKEEEKVPNQGEGGWAKAGPMAVHWARALPLGSSLNLPRPHIPLLPHRLESWAGWG